MSTQAFVIDVDEQDFEREVVERSHSVPVVIDFWADWCGPCKALSPVLERLAAEAQGGWVLAKVDVDSNPRLAQAFGVQGIPAVKAVKGGRLVAEFTGALPEPQVREWLTVLGPTPAELALERARRLEDQGDSGAALEAYREVLREEPGTRKPPRRWRVWSWPSGRRRGTAPRRTFAGGWRQILPMWRLPERSPTWRQPEATSILRSRCC
jgi:putative thioredoxin